ncbi:hypothetical protein CN692_21440 [Bacillus sp. AFS002410]|uniref:hypothetical protein n=1 Tax=Bacillus sp. AFS002410 TaxID=2033481 RepID=UPI000BF11FE0|nr:hypothetical protein [Bacillus sp. AFS002410]PEJ53313.1 hypothetical protein CN692_21440 [Bacillus sp. AFS002410]
MNIPILSKIDLKQLLDEFQIQDVEYAPISIGNNHAIYILFAEEIPEAVREASSTSKKNYKAMELFVDWTNGDLLHANCINFGQIKPNIHFIEPIGEYILLLGSRTSLYKNGTFDNNAVIMSRDGNLINEFCLGDGIEQCLVDSQQNIITSYFDEGVFGNNRWNNPIGASGLIKWTKDGKKLWENSKYDICDCYAINIDTKDNLWFYYYTDFKLVKTNDKKDIVFTPNISGAASFLFNQRQNGILIDGGYKKHGQFTYMDLGDDKLRNSKPCQFEFEGKPIQYSQYTFRNSKAIFLTQDRALYITNWI